MPGNEDWQQAFAEAISAISDLGGAKPGDRTMLDALQPALNAWVASGRFTDAATAAETGAAATAQMFPALGRASYLGHRALGIPDGGAVAVAVWLKALAGTVG